MDETDTQVRRELLADLYGQWAAEMILLALAIAFALSWSECGSQKDRSIDIERECESCELVRYRSQPTYTLSGIELSRLPAR